MYGSDTLDIMSANPGASKIKVDFTGTSNEWDQSVFFDPQLVDNFSSPGTQTGFIGWPLKDVVIDLSIVGARTGWLDVANIYKDPNSVSGELYIELSKPLKGEQDAATGGTGIETGGILSVLPTGAGEPTVKMAKKVVKNKTEFDGKFFVKIRKDAVVNDYVRSVYR